MTKQYDRFFAFGCSYTQYPWPTWADILGQSFGEHYYNFGRPGAGNIFIYHMVMQADEKYHFTPNDLIIVQWSSWLREDRYMEGNWKLSELHNFYFNEKYFDARGYLMRDLGLIKGVRELLTHRACDYKFLALITFSLTERTRYHHFYKDLQQVLELYQHILQEIPISYEEFFSVVDRPKLLRDNVWLHNGHRTPMEHLQYIQHVIPELVPNDVSFVHDWEDKFSSTYSGDTPDNCSPNWSYDWSNTFRGVGNIPL